jgi:hypothetical protein
VENEEILQRVREEKNILCKIKQRNVHWIGKSRVGTANAQRFVSSLYIFCLLWPV